MTTQLNARFKDREQNCLVPKPTRTYVQLRELVSKGYLNFVFKNQETYFATRSDVKSHTGRLVYFHRPPFDSLSPTDFPSFLSCIRFDALPLLPALPKVPA